MYVGGWVQEFELASGRAHQTHLAPADSWMVRWVEIVAGWWYSVDAGSNTGLGWVVNTKWLTSQHTGQLIGGGNHMNLLGDFPMTSNKNI